MTPDTAKNYAQARLLMAGAFTNYLVVGIDDDGKVNADFLLSPKHALAVLPQVHKAVFKSAGIELPQPKLNGKKKR